MKSLKVFAFFCVQIAAIAFADGSGPKRRPDFDWGPASLFAIQDRGRVKPLDTFARESLQFVSGKTAWKRMSPTEVVFSWLIEFDKEWTKEPFIRVAYGPVKKILGLDADRQFFSPEELRSNDLLKSTVRQVMQKQSKNEPLTENEKKIQQVHMQRSLVDAIVSGQAVAILPNPQDINAPWLTLSSLADQSVNQMYQPAQVELLRQSTGAMLEAFNQSKAAEWKTATEKLGSVLANDLVEKGYPKPSDLNREWVYNHFRPFRWAWVGYLVAFVLLASFLVTEKRPFQWFGIGALLTGFLVHSGGFVLRMLVSGRPPVTNMYESVIWVSWGCVLFSLIIGFSYKKAIIPASASVFAIVSLVLADTLPSVLDPSIQPLEPVLRSNFWLTIHVLTITLSYAAFALSLCLGNVVLGHFVFKPAKTSVIQYSSLYMYRAIQIGVVLLAAGTILGGIWADYSWGRFWGWDPKEVWALIALLLYLAVLHGRFSGLLQVFGFAAFSVLSFLGVLMAWYGVNFILGAGLHSYGFGTGGTGYVVGYTLAQLAFIGVAYWRYQTSPASKKKFPIFPTGK
jgi:cytochrome c-type biogenesis protein CcsB